MEPMKPLEPLHGMKPMAPFSREGWWPAEYGAPSMLGSARGTRYAYFPHRRRLILERAGKLTTFDSGEHEFRGVAQPSTSGGVTFISQHGRVDVDSLATV
jgi:hypothetical protein